MANDYRKALLEAELETEQETERIERETVITERLNLLDGEIGEAERKAAEADSPRLRVDGKVYGIGSPGRPLTKAMETFARGIIEGKTRRAAYREAYPDSQASDNTISAAAHKLMKDQRIQRLINESWEETQDLISDDLNATKRYVMRALLAISKTGKAEGSRLKALELLGRHAGMWKEQVTEEKRLTADDLRRELSAHLKLVKGGG